jgi:hypothetical protein
MSSCRKAMYGGLFKIVHVRYKHKDLPLRPSHMLFQYHDILLGYRPTWGDGACTFKSVWRPGGCGRISLGTWVVEMAAETHEATPWEGVRLRPTIALEVGPTLARGESLTQAVREAARSSGDGPRDCPPPIKPYTEGFGLNVRTQHL